VPTLHRHARRQLRIAVFISPAVRGRLACLGLWEHSIVPPGRLAGGRRFRAGDGASQWLLGSLYLFGLGVPKDRDTGIALMQTATRTAIPAIRAAIPRDPFSEMELFSTMLTAAATIALVRFGSRIG